MKKKQFKIWSFFLTSAIFQENLMFLTNVVAITTSIVLAKIISTKWVYCFPLYVIYNEYVNIKRKFEMAPYLPFYKDKIINDNIKEKQNVLFMCHGRNHGYPEIHDVTGELIFTIHNCNFESIDINQSSWPDWISSILNPGLFKDALETDKYDFVVLFNCPCCTYDVNVDPNILPNIRKILKPDGVLLVKYTEMDHLKSAGFRMISEDLTVNFTKISNFKELSHIMDYFTYPRPCQHSICRTFKLTRYVKCDVKCDFEVKSNN